MPRSRRKYRANEEYVYTHEAQHVIDRHYPDTLHPRDASFTRAMIDLQRALILVHLPDMNRADRQRAYATLAELQI